MKKTVTRALLIVGILAGAVAIMAVLVSMKPEPETKEAKDTRLLVDVSVAEETSVRFEVQSQGTVRPRTETVVSSEVAGQIVSISPAFVAGGLFQAGDELLRIDPTNYTVALDQAQALVTQRQIEYDGAERIRKKGYAAESEVASAAAALASAKAELVRARRNLERTRIRLPYNGMVRAKEVDLGQYVGPGTRLGVTFATSEAEIRLPLTETDLRFLELPPPGIDAAGPAVRLTSLQGDRPANWEATIVRTEGVVDEQSSVTYAVASVDDPYSLTDDNEAAPLPVGTFVDATIEGREVEAIVRIPRLALRGRNRVLFVDAEDRIRIRTVDVLRADEDFAYLTGGIEPGERVSTTVIEAPVNGLAVRVSGSAASAAAPGTTETARSNP